MMFLKIEGVDGGSTRRGFEKCIELFASGWGASDPRQGVPGQISDQSVSGMTVSGLQVVKAPDKATSALLTRFFNGQQIEKVELIEVKTENKRSKKVREITLENVKVRDFHLSSSGENSSADTFTFSFAKVTWTDFDPDGNPADTDSVDLCALV